MIYIKIKLGDETHYVNNSLQICQKQNAHLFKEEEFIIIKKALNIVHNNISEIWKEVIKEKKIRDERGALVSLLRLLGFKKINNDLQMVTNSYAVNDMGTLFICTNSNHTTKFNFTVDGEYEI